MCMEAAAPIAAARATISVWFETQAWSSGACGRTRETDLAMSLAMAIVRLLSTALHVGEQHPPHMSRNESQGY